MRIDSVLKFLVLSIVMVLPSCDNDTLTDGTGEQETGQRAKALTFVQELELGFGLEGFEDPTGQIKDNLVVDWNSYVRRTVDDQEWYEFGVKEKRPVTHENSKIKGYTYTLLATEGKKGVRYYLNKMLSFSDDNPNTYFNIEKDKYHGMVYLYNMGGVAEYIMHYQKGNKISGIENLKVADALGKFVGQTARGGCHLKQGTSAKPCTRGAYACAVSLNAGPSCSGTRVGGYLPITTHYYTDWYNKRGSRHDYSYTQYRGSSTEYVWVSRGGGSSVNQASYTYATSDGSGNLTFSNSRPRGTSPEKERFYAATSPSCESFDFHNVGNTGVQVAGVIGIWDVVTKWGKCPGIGVAASYQTYYFHLPAYLPRGMAAEKSAIALKGAFFDLQKWFQKQPCNKIMTGVLAQKMDEFIKINFKEIGGQATRNTPLGWSGLPRPYIEDWSGTDNCF